MPDLKHESMYAPGAKFFRSHEKGSPIMFVHVVDGKNKIGPYEAGDDEIKAHPKAYELFEAEDAQSHRKHPDAAILTDGSSQDLSEDGKDPGAMMVPEAGDERQWIADPNQDIDAQDVSIEADSGAGGTKGAPPKRGPGRPKKDA